MSQKIVRAIASFIYCSFIYAISCTIVFAQTAALLPNALQQYFDNNGDPLSSGTVGFYYPSTLNLKPVWEDSGEATPWTNPITLDAGGKPPGAAAGIYGQGVYRQIVKDVNNNLIWDAVTTAPGTTSTAATGDGDLVGTVKPWAGIQAPNQYLFAYGEQISRTTYSVLFSAITQTQNVVCATSNNTLTGIADTTQINIGAPVEVSCVIPGTTVVSKTSSTVVMSNPSTANLNTTATFFPFGNGDGSTTFTLPDFRGNVIAGRPNMGGTASTNLTNAYCVNPTAQGAVCGSQSTTLLQVNLPAIKPALTSVVTDPGHTHTINGVTGVQSYITPNGQFSSNSGTGVQNPARITATDSATTGITVATTFNSNLGSSTAFSIVQPTITLNYIIKVLPDSNSAIATGVTSLGGMTGDIACGSGLSCTGNIVSVTGGGGGGTPGGANTQVQINQSGLFGASANLTFVSPILTIGASSTTGQLSIVGSGSGNVIQTVQSTAGSPIITWGNTSGTPAVTATSPLTITTANGNVACSTCAITSNPLSQFAATTSAQLAGVLSNETGTGFVVFSSSPTLVTPTLGAAIATSINGLTLTSSTGALTIANTKTLTANNSLTLAGIDATTITFQGTDTYVGRTTTDTLTNKTYDTAGTGNVFKINGVSITAIGGNTGTVGTTTGALTSGHCVSIDANLNFVDAGGACTTGGGGGTVSSGTAGQLTYYGSTGTVVIGNANATVSSGALTLGIATSVQGSLKLAGSTSGSTTIAAAVSGGGTMTLQTGSDTIVGRATTDTLTNKTLTSPVIATITNTGTLTLPTSTDTLVGRATTDTLTHKTYDTAGTGNSFSINGNGITAISGNTGTVGTTSGVLTNNDCASFDASGNVIDAGAPCGTSGVTSIASRTGAFTLGNGLTNSSNQLLVNQTAPTVQRFTSGTSLTYTPTSGTIRIDVKMCGGGGGGAGATANNGSAGTATSFGSWTAAAGLGGTANSGAGGGVPTAGTNGTGTLVARYPGNPGDAGGTSGSQSSGRGGSSGLFGGGAGATPNGQTGNNGTANTGGGGSGGGGAGPSAGGGGGSSGECVEFLVTSPSATTYTVGGGGNGGAAGNHAGGTGGTSIIVIEEFYI